MGQINKIAQLKLWENCSVCCNFCYLNDRNIISIEERRRRLIRSKDMISDLAKNYYRIGLIGGEFFTGELVGLENEWISLLSEISKYQFDQVWIATSLLQKDLSLLITSLEILKYRHPIVCTSYDPEGRFRTVDEEERWKSNKTYLLNAGYEVNITVIPTKKVINGFKTGSLSFLRDCTSLSLSDPQLRYKFTLGCKRDSSYNHEFTANNNIFILPTRNEFLEFLSSEPEILRNYARYEGVHSNTIIDFDRPYIQDHDRYDTSDPFYLDSRCGHPYIARWYPDSDQCAMCDAELLFQSMELGSGY